MRGAQGKVEALGRQRRVGADDQFVLLPPANNIAIYGLQTPGATTGIPG